MRLVLCTIRKPYQLYTTQLQRNLQLPIKLTSKSKEDMFYKRIDHKLVITHDADDD